MRVGLSDTLFKSFAAVSLEALLSFEFVAAEPPPFADGLELPPVREATKEPLESAIELLPVFAVSDNVCPAELCDDSLPPATAVDRLAVSVFGLLQAVSRRHIAASKAPQRHNILFFNPNPPMFL